MGQPENAPVFEGLDSSWNDVVSAFPEERRDELAGALKSRIDAYEPLKQWEDFTKSGITPEQAGQALNIYSTIENDPRRVYEAIGKSLGITAQQAQEVIEEVEEEDDGLDPRFKTMQQQIETMGQILLMQKQGETQANLAREAEASIDRDIAGLKKKYGDVDEQEVIFRMLHADMTPEQAYQDYTRKFAEVRARRPSPLVMGGGGQVPQKQIDVTKLNNQDVKSVVAQMLTHANEQVKQA